MVKRIESRDVLGYAIRDKAQDDRAYNIPVDGIVELKASKI